MANCELRILLITGLLMVWAECILERFGATLRDEVDVDQLSEHMVTVVRETVQPESVNFWLQRTK